MNVNIEYEQEEDGRWLAKVIGLPGVLSYGNTPVVFSFHDREEIESRILARIAKYMGLKLGGLVWKKYSELYPYINSRAVTHTGIQGQ